jgi:hypothetical protein
MTAEIGVSELTKEAFVIGCEMCRATDTDCRLEPRREASATVA